MCMYTFIYICIFIYTLYYTYCIYGCIYIYYTYVYILYILVTNNNQGLYIGIRISLKKILVLKQ